MKATQFNTITCTASLHSHGHAQAHEGPWSMRVGVKGQPMVVRDWEGTTVLLSVEQPNKEDNFTLIRIMFLRSGRQKPSLVTGTVFHRAKWYRRPGDVIEMRLKRKLGKSFKHPVPIGKYDGTCMYDVDGGFAVFNLQATTLRTEAKPSEPKVIITPGDENYNVTLRDAKRALSRTDELGGRRIDACRLRHGQLPDGLPSGLH